MIIGLYRLQKCGALPDTCAMEGSTGGPAGSEPGSGDINERLSEIAAELAGAATFKEPSAAERARTAAARTAAARSAAGRGGPLRRWRNRRMAAKLRKPVQSTSGSRQPQRGRRGDAPARRSRPVRSILTAVIVVAILVAASFGLRKLHSSGRPATLPRPTQAATRIPVPPFSAADPFAGSPAESFAAGATGIIAPAARAHASFTAAQVASALQTVKRLLVAAYLNPATLRGGKPTAFAALLIKQQRAMFYLDLKARPGHAGSTRAWLTSFAPGTDLVGNVIKVHGDPMKISVTSYRGVAALEIRVNYLFVYPVEQRGDAFSRIRVIIRTQASVLFYQWDDPGGKLEPWLRAIATSFAAAQCGTTDGFVHPAFPQAGPGKHRPSGVRIDPYNLNAPQIKKGCHPTTRT